MPSYKSVLNASQAILDAVRSHETGMDGHETFGMAQIAAIAETTGKSEDYLTWKFQLLAWNGYITYSSLLVSEDETEIEAYECGLTNKADKLKF